MEEKRRSLRTELKAELLMNRLDKEMDELVTIEVCDVSKTGMGFFCAEELEMGSVYECFLTIWTKEVIHAFVEIVRSEKADARYRYGATFVGMNDQDAYRIQVYQTVEENKE